MGLDLLFKVLFSLSFLFLPANHLWGLIKHFSLPGSTIWQLNEVLCLSFLSFCFVGCEVFEILGTAHRIQILYIVFAIRIITLRFFFWLRFFILKFLKSILDLLLPFHFLLVDFLIIILDFIVAVIASISPVVILIDHFIVGPFFALALALFAGPIAVDLDVGLQLVLLSLHLKFRDEEGFCSGQVTLQLRVVLILKVEADIDGDSAGHVGINCYSLCAQRGKKTTLLCTHKLLYWINHITTPQVRSPTIFNANVDQSCPFYFRCTPQPRLSHLLFMTTFLLLLILLLILCFSCFRLIC